MPEIKNNFLQGKMNKDLDARLIPNGQYRDANNIEVSTAEDNSVGIVKNIVGNKHLQDNVPIGFKCVGTIADEKTNKLYWFISSYEKDAILEYNVEQDVVIPVIVDINASNSKACLKFAGNIITGINIINNLLFWTDNNSEPKKINIDECKKGTIDDGTLDHHTQLIYDTGSFWGIGLYHVHRGSTTNLIENPFNQNGGRYAWFEKKQMDAVFQEDVYNDSHLDRWIRHYRDNKFIGVKRIRIWTESSAASTYTSGATPSNGTHFRSHPFISASSPGGLEQSSEYRNGDVIFAHGIHEHYENGVTIDIQERHITVIKPKPLKSLAVQINYERSLTSTGTKPNLFEEKFPRFSYRYKYRDGELSPFAPFTEPVFNAAYTKNVKDSINTNIFHNKDTIYDVKEPYNLAMKNSIHSVDLADFITSQIPEDVVEIEILYKKEDSPIVYSIDTIKHTDSAWHAPSQHEHRNIGLGQGDGRPDTYHTDGGLTKGLYTVDSENILAALPANQILRPWDNVPRRALGQEVTGSRIVYGNYLQNYNLENYTPKVSLNYSSRVELANMSNTGNGGLKSIKSQRNYQLGVVYCDKYGRETPVFTSKDGAVYTSWESEDGVKNASKSLALTARALANFPEWVDHIKFFIKEDVNDYYNLVMGRAWRAKTTWDLDNSEGHLWISFPSSDRNKVSEEDYIVLKKKIGVGEEQVPYENKFQILDISNEAPDAVKYRMANMGVQTNGSGELHDDLLFDEEHRIDLETDLLFIDWEIWTNIIGGIPLQESGSYATTDGMLKLNDNGGDASLYVSWRLLDANGDGQMSQRYRIVGVLQGQDGYIVRLASSITKVDADLAHINGRSEDGNAGLNLPTGLMFQIERKELKDLEDFSGKFFVKISKNKTTELIELGETVEITKSFVTRAARHHFYWRDNIGTDAQVDSANYGLTNYGGYTGGPVSSGGHSSIHHSVNNVVGDVAGQGGINPTDVLRVSDYAAPWQGIYETYGSKGGFFIDAMHMVSCQSEESDYAKFSGIHWSGRSPGASSGGNAGNYITLNRHRHSYPAHRMWITDWLQSDVVPEESDIDDETLTRWSRTIDDDLFRVSTKFAVEVDQELGSRTVEQSQSSTPAADGCLPLTGWVGPRQRTFVKTGVYTGGNAFATWDNQTHQNNHINGLEGIVTTTEIHTKGARRWLDGMVENKNNFKKQPLKMSQIYAKLGPVTTYGGGLFGMFPFNVAQAGPDNKHFLHLSFFAPGKDLINQDLFPTQFKEFTEDSVGENLQGVWGGGHFETTHKSIRLGSETDFDKKHSGIDLEGNMDYETGRWNQATPGPGVGYGYNVDYRELHERQWDPLFSDNLTDKDKKAIEEVIKNLFAGNRFKFSTDSSDTIYTIKNVHKKKIYNHTAWREPFNRACGNDGLNSFANPSTAYTELQENQYFKDPSSGDGVRDSGYYTSQHKNYRSVEHQALLWLDTLDKFGEDGAPAKEADFKQKLEDFGKAHNRRVCYIIELDKDPTAEGNYNPLDDMGADRGHNAFSTTGFDTSSSDYEGSNIEFVTPTESALLHELHKHPAIWETSLKKKDVDVDIYYEASNAIPVKLNEQTNELIAPLGCRVEMVGEAGNYSSYLMGWSGKVAEIEPGFPRGDGSGEFDYTGVNFKFIKHDGSYVIITADENQLIGVVDGFKTDFNFREDIGTHINAGLSWYNCFSFGNGIESNRIKDEFNKMFIFTGVKASSRLQETYKQERRSHGLIYSGLYNSNAGINDLNQFIMAEKITKDLNPTYGSIQKLFQRRISLVAFCEDRVVQITSNKDTIFNADANPQLVASDKVLGDATPFAGEYGISKNPESFATESYRAYFTDKQRGSVLRLSKDGLTPISSAGMHDWFRDNLKQYSSLVGTYDKYKQDYNLSLSHAWSENLIVNEYFEEGDVSIPLQGSFLNHVENHSPSTGMSLLYPWQQIDFSAPAVYSNTNIKVSNWNSGHEGIHTRCEVWNYAEIPFEHYQTETADAYTTGTIQVPDPNYVYAYPIMAEYKSGTTSGSFNSGNYTNGWTGDLWMQNNALFPIHGGFSGSYLPASMPGGTGNEFWIPNHILGPEVQSSVLASGAYYMDGVAWGYGPRAKLRRSIPSTGALRDESVITPNDHEEMEVFMYYNNSTSSTWYYDQENWLYPTGTAQRGAHTDPSLTHLNNPTFGKMGFKQMLASYVVNPNLHGKGFIFNRVYTGNNPENAFIAVTGLGSDQHLCDFPANGPGLENSTAPQYQNNSSIGLGTMYSGDELVVVFTCWTYQSYTNGSAMGETWLPTTPTTFGPGAHVVGELGYNRVRPVLTLCDGDVNNIVSDDCVFIPQNYGGPANAGNISSAVAGATFTNADNPFHWAYSSPSTYGLAMFGNPGETWYTNSSLGYGGPGWLDRSNITVSNAQGVSEIDTHFQQCKSWCDSSTVVFPTTNFDIDGLRGPDCTPENAKMTYTCIARFKFKDPTVSVSNLINQEDSSIVVNDLVVKISQNHADAGYGVGWAGINDGTEELLSYPLWGVEDIAIYKQNGIDQSEAIQGTISQTATVQTQWARPAIPGPTTTGFDTSTNSIPAWCQVNHLGFDDWGGAPSGGTPVTGSYQGHTEAMLQSVFGNNVDATSTLYDLIDDTTGAVSGTISIPRPANTPSGQTAQPYPHHKYNVAGVIGTPAYSAVNHGTQYWKIDQPAGGARKIEMEMGEDWTVGDWYVLDVEFSTGTSPNAGHGGNDGVVKIWGVASSSSYSWSNPVGDNSWGTYVTVDTNGTGSMVKSIRLEPFLDRQEFPPHKDVVRALFKIENDCEVITNTAYNQVLYISFENFVNPGYLTRIRFRKINELNDTGEAQNWDNNEGFYYATDGLNGPHSFSLRTTYFRAGKLCIEKLSSQPHSYWRQIFEQYVSPPYTRPRPTTTPGGWKLNFTVSNNPVTGDFAGEVTGYITNKEGDGGTSYSSYHQGITFYNITDVGSYSIYFNMDGLQSNGLFGPQVNPANLAGQPWFIERNGSPYPSGTVEARDASLLQDATKENRILFASETNLDCRFAISNIELTDQTIVYQGGSSGSWTYYGFNTSTDDYIVWDEDVINGVANQRLLFNNMPLIDPFPATLGITELISASQFINKTINRYEKYKIKFYHNITSGSLHIYYFNNLGFGFRIYDINSTSGVQETPGVYTFEEDVEIGQEQWQSMNPVSSAYLAEFKEAFVIRMEDNSSVDVNGWLDGISMTRIHTGDNDLEDTTISYSEDVSGWYSFKSFVPENGISISKDYFTFIDGKLHKHYIPQKFDAANTNWIDCAIEEANNYNRFYGAYDNSSIRFVLNLEPSIVKSFNTINYEGSQARIKKPNTALGITQNNFEAWQLGGGNNNQSFTIGGWDCGDIITNLEQGNVYEFIKKEDKWFNYIRGSSKIEGENILDSKQTSVHGLGSPSQATIIQIDVDSPPSQPQGTFQNPPII